MFERLRWPAVLVVAVVVGSIELMSDTVLDQALPFPWDTAVVVGAVGVLTFAFASLTLRRMDMLAGDLARRNVELEAREAAASTLHRVSVASAALHDLDEVLALVVKSARQLLAADVAVLTLSQPDGTEALQSSSGKAETLRPRSPGGTPTGGADVASLIRPEFAVARLATPLRRGTATIGHLLVASAQPRTYAVGDVETLGSLANQAAIAIENASLQARLRELAVVDERERIARELHDGIAQVLGYVNTKSQAAEELLAAGNTTAARMQIRELGAAARSVYVDVREAILGLRSPIGDGQDLVPAIEAYASRFADAAKIAVSIDADEPARTATLAPDVQANLFRILQESLTNVRKHAAARRVVVTVRVAEGALVLRLADDGRGMEPAGPPPGQTDHWPHYGVAAMRERADAVGATIAWRDRPAGGTEVELSVPLDSGGTTRSEEVD